VDVATTPELYPAFRPEISDYVVRCDGTPVQVQVTTSGNGRAAVDGQPAQAGPFTASVPLAENQEFSVSTSGGGATGNYHVRCLPAGFPSWTAERTGETQARWYIVTPVTAPPAFVIIFDTNGVPVWWFQKDTGRPSDAKLLPNGHLAWVFPSAGGFGSNPDSQYEERTLDGSLVRHISTVGSPTDHHDLQPLPNGNYLLLTYVPRDHVDLSPYGGPSDATVLDAEIQEIDPTGALVWSWNSKDHIGLEETGRWYDAQVIDLPPKLPDGRTAYDIIHINAVQPAGDHILFSGRHLDAVYEIDRSTGDIEWKLGGTTTPQSLTIVGDAFSASDFGGQHDVRVLDDGTVTLHDNGTARGRAPRALRFSINTGMKTATLIEALRDPEASSSPCCGGARRLPGGDWVIAWGGLPLTTELSASGQRIFRLQFSPDQGSYRANPVLPGLLSPSELRQGMDARFPR
jgi:Arylsulfotransferase (ASST)